MRLLAPDPGPGGNDDDEDDGDDRPTPRRRTRFLTIGGPLGLAGRRAGVRRPTLFGA